MAPSRWFFLIYLVLVILLMSFISSMTSLPHTESPPTEESFASNENTRMSQPLTRKSDRAPRTKPDTSEEEISVSSWTTAHKTIKKPTADKTIPNDTSVARTSENAFKITSEMVEEKFSVSTRQMSSPTTIETIQQNLTEEQNITVETSVNRASGRASETNIISSTRSSLDMLSENEEILPDYDFVEDLEKIASLTYTCRGKCGDQYALPCSCAPVCLVYDNCCENISLDCPDIIAEGQENFGSYIGAEIVCEHEEVYMIASCPDGEDVSDGATNMELATTEMERKILAAPVTDETTGLTFLNTSYYNCHASSDKPRKLLHWGLRFKYPEVSPLTLDELSYHEHIIIPYGPMFDMRKLRDHRCYSNRLINSCEGAASPDIVPAAVAASDAEKCQLFTAYVYDDWSVSNNVYRNRHCGFCHIGRNSGLALVSSFSQAYSIDPSVAYILGRSLNAGEVSLRLEKSSDIPEKPFAESTCPLTITRESGGEIEEKKGKICENVCGNARYSVKSDGRCKATRRTAVAMSDNYLGIEPLKCVTALERIADFMSCTMSQVDREPWKYSDITESAVSVVFDTRTKRRLYLVDLIFDTPSLDTGLEIMAVREEDMAYNIYKAAVAVKAYQKYRLNNSMCENQEGRMTDEGKGLEVSAEFESQVLSKTIQPLYAGLLEYRGAIVDKENVSILCVSDIVDVAEGTPQLSCMKDKIHEDDEKEIDKLLNSVCADRLHHRFADTQRDRAGTCNQCPHYLLALGIVLVYIQHSISFK